MPAPWNKGLTGDEYKSHYPNGFKGIFKEGNVPWHSGTKGLGIKKCKYKGKTLEERFGKEKANEMRVIISKANKGKPSWNKGIKQWENKIHPRLGIKHTDETKRKISEKNTGNISWSKGKKFPEHSLEKHHNWKGGLSFQDYPIEFNKELKEFIRRRDNYSCQECRFIQNGYKLHVHHIDFNKKNNNPSNLISLCRSCHTKTNYNRENWTEHFKNKGGGC